MADNKPKEKCRICKKPFVNFPMGEKNGFRFIACKPCGSVMADPWITQDELDAYFGPVQPQITHLPEPDEQVNTMSARLRRVFKDPKGKRFVDVASRQGYGVRAARDAGMEAMG